MVNPQSQNNGALIRLEKVSKRFGELRVLDEIDLSFERGVTTTIIGKSGVGKSVLLKVIMGLLDFDSGDIFFEGQSCRRMDRAARRAFKSKVSYMFQNTALFDSMTVFENVALPLAEKTKLPKAEIRERVLTKIEQLELQKVTEKYPAQISGGMKKRVALARALITAPEIILFDEPTTGLDPIRRRAVYEMIDNYRRQFGFTAILVSHDVPSVFEISQRVAMLNDARIIFDGTPQEIETSSDNRILEFIRED